MQAKAAGGNSLAARAKAAHAALLGRPLPAAGPAGGSAAREADKKVVAGELRRRALDRWTRHVAERERTGMAFYCGASAPGAVGGLRTRVPPAGCDLTGRRMLVAQRLGGHYLQSCVGAWRGAERALRLRSCPRCLLDWPGLGLPPVEDEAHYWAECPSLLPARQRMLAELEGAYPGFGRRYAALPRLDKGRALVFAVLRCPTARGRRVCGGGCGRAACGRWCGTEWRRRCCARCWGRRCGAWGVNFGDLFGDTRAFGLQRRIPQIPWPGGACMGAGF